MLKPAATWRPAMTGLTKRPDIPRTCRRKRLLSHADPAPLCPVLSPQHNRAGI